MDYLTVKQISEQWGLTVRRVQDLCKSGAIPGAVRWGREWMIPPLAVKPDDGRKKPVIRATGDTSADHKREQLTLLTRYNKPGTADRVLESLKDDPLMQNIFRIQLYHAQGDVLAAKELLYKLKAQEQPGSALRTLVGFYMAQTAIVLGDLSMWKEAQEHLESGEIADPVLRVQMDFWYAVNKSIINDTSYFPDWFRRGDFSPLPRELHPMARLCYAKYLYISAHEIEKYASNQHPVVSFLQTLPLILEPLITQTAVEGVMVTELQLRLLCAIAYHISGEDQLAILHIDRSLQLALPDRLYLPLAENRHRLGNLLDDRLMATDPKAFANVKRLSKACQQGWITLHNAVHGTTLSDALTLREQQICKLAVYGLSNKEIAERLNISVNAVKQALRCAMDKTGTNNRSELYRYV